MTEKNINQLDYFELKNKLAELEGECSDIESEIENLKYKLNDVERDCEKVTKAIKIVKLNYLSGQAITYKGYKAIIECVSSLPAFRAEIVYVLENQRVVREQIGETDFNECEKLGTDESIALYAEFKNAKII